MKTFHSSIRRSKKGKQSPPAGLRPDWKPAVVWRTPADPLAKASLPLPAPSRDANVVDKIDYTPDSDQDDTKERLVVSSIKTEKDSQVLNICIIIAIPSCHADYLASRLRKSAKMDQPSVIKRIRHPHFLKQARPLALQSPMWTYQLGPIGNGMQFLYLCGSNS